MDKHTLRRVTEEPNSASSVTAAKGLDGTKTGASSLASKTSTLTKVSVAAEE